MLDHSQDGASRVFEVLSLSTLLQRRRVSSSIRRAGRVVAKHLGSFIGVSVGPLAVRPLALKAKKTFSAADIERDDDPIPDFEILIAPADFNHFPHELVTKNVTFLHAGNVPIVQMQI
jgi:hypothetical protein